jgi:hypothetical protein
MNCDPQALMAAAKCYRCIPAGMLPEVQISLLCQWLNASQAVPKVFSYSPATVTVTWTDKNGNDSGNLAYFYAHADIPSVVVLYFSDALLSSFTNLSALPNLAALSCSGSFALTQIDISYCLKLTTLAAPTCGLTSVSGLQTCPLLNNVDVSGDGTGISKLPVSVVNYILQTLLAGGLTGGACFTFSQTPPAPPSGAGAAAKAALLAEVPAWNVVTD